MIKMNYNNCKNYSDNSTFAMHHVFHTLQGFTVYIVPFQLDHRFFDDRNFYKAPQIKTEVFCDRGHIVDRIQ